MTMFYIKFFGAAKLRRKLHEYHNFLKISTIIYRIHKSINSHLSSILIYNIAYITVFSNFYSKIHLKIKE